MMPIIRSTLFLLAAVLLTAPFGLLVTLVWLYLELLRLLSKFRSRD